MQAKRVHTNTHGGSDHYETIVFYQLVHQFHVIRLMWL